VRLGPVVVVLPVPAAAATVFAAARAFVDASAVGVAITAFVGPVTEAFTIHLSPALLVLVVVAAQVTGTVKVPPAATFAVGKVPYANVP
jgi:hypothetical protein